MKKGSQNLATYNDPVVVQHYAFANELQECEVYVFDNYIPTGTEILDIGVGGGRTVSYLAAKASRYLGVDYAESMVEVCRAKFSSLEFEKMDATNMSTVNDESFDVAVFSFNGIDCISSNEARFRCFSEIRRILKPGGRLIFSSHNAKALAVWPRLHGVNTLRRCWRIIRAVFLSTLLAPPRLLSKSFRDDNGYFLDNIHGGLYTYSATPETMRRQIEDSGFILVDVVGESYPDSVPKYFIPWYYYVADKAQ